MTNILNLMNNTKIIYKKFSHEGKLVDIINLRRKEIDEIWEVRNIFGRIDTEGLMDRLPSLSEIASQCCDDRYTGVLVGICDAGFRGICKYHESFSYKCAEIISSSCKRERIKAFVGIRQMDEIYILHEVPLSVKLLVL